MQQLWGSDMSKAAKLVLDGDVRATVPSMEEMVDFWTPTLTTPSKEIEPEVDRFKRIQSCAGSLLR